MGLLDSIRGIAYTNKTDSTGTGSTERRNEEAERVFLTPEERHNGYKVVEAPEMVPEAYPGGPKYCIMFYRKVTPDNFSDCKFGELKSDFFKWLPFKNPEKTDKQQEDLNNKFFDIFRRNIPVKDENGWQSYPLMDVKATAKDYELLKRRGASTTTNDSNGAAQFVEGKDNKSVKIKGDMQKPEYIQITDTTNGKKNVYTYRKLSDNELGGKNVQMGNMKGNKLNGKYEYDFKKGWPDNYYILESVVDENGNDLMKKDHVVVYRLKSKVSIDSGTAQYELVQDKKCDGNNQSSMKYHRRAK